MPPASRTVCENVNEPAALTNLMDTSSTTTTYNNYYYDYYNKL